VRIADLSCAKFDNSAFARQRVPALLLIAVGRQRMRSVIHGDAVVHTIRFAGVHALEPHADARARGRFF
jgi:hypothetical protein